MAAHAQDAMEAVKQAIIHTPIWVWPALALLIWIGARRMRTRSLSLGRLIVLPAVFLVLSAVNAFSSGLPLLEAVGIWLAGLALGGLLGQLTTPRQGVVVDRARGRLTVPGSVVPLLIILVIFVGRYATGYSFGRWPQLRHDEVVLLIAGGYAALCTGFMLGRTAPLLLAYFRAPLDGAKPA